ncbi:MAG: hypothetical protein ACI8YQ_001516 [Polaribacter sp.]|jgi:hypothetical protein
MNQGQKERWERTRAKGKGHFVWMVGVLRWGLMSGFVISTMMYLQRNGWDVGLLFTMEYLSRLSFMLLMFAVFGYLWGQTVWSLTEKKYLSENE